MFLEKEITMKLFKIKLLVLAALMLAANSAFASYSVDFTVDTRSLIGTTGYLDLQFNPGNDFTGAASASVINYSPSVSLVGAALLSGSAFNSLPGTVTFSNIDANLASSAYNDYFQQVNFGDSLKFRLTLDGAAGSSFYLSFLNQDQSAFVLTNDAHGVAASVDLNADGIAVNNNSDQVSATPTPVPAAAWLLGSGLMGLFGIRRKKA
jgi:hypothetical protein